MDDNVTTLGELRDYLDRVKQIGMDWYIIEIQNGQPHNLLIPAGDDINDHLKKDETVLVDKLFIPPNEVESVISHLLTV